MNAKNQVATIEGTSLNPYASASGNELGNVAPSQGNAMITAESQRAIAEIQAQSIMAMNRPRNPIVCVDRMLVECQRKSLAEQALYSFARGGSSISGLSIRALEMCARNWGNIRYGFRILERKGGRSLVQAYAYDIESNVPVERTFEVRHWRDTKQGGKPVTDERDIYELEANNAQRRVRSCLEALIPGDVLEAIEEAVRKTLTATADTSPEGIQKMLAALANFGINRSMVEARIQRKIEAIEAAQMVSLRSVHNSLRDGMSSVDQWFDMALADASATKDDGQPDLKKSIAEKKTEPKTEGKKPDAKGSETAPENAEKPATKTVKKEEATPAADDVIQVIDRETGEIRDMMFGDWDKMLPLDRPERA